MNGSGFVLCTHFSCFKSLGLLLSWTALSSAASFFFFFFARLSLFTLQLSAMAPSLLSGSRCSFSGAPRHLCVPQRYLNKRLYPSASLTRLCTVQGRGSALFLLLSLAPSPALLPRRCSVNPCWADQIWLGSFLVFLNSDLPAFSGKSDWGGGFLLEPKIGTFVIVHLTKKEKKINFDVFGGCVWSWKVDVCIVI